MYIRETEYLPCRVLKKSDLKREMLFCLILIPAAVGVFGVFLFLMKNIISENYYMGLPIAVLICVVLIGLMKRIEILGRKIRSTISNGCNYITEDMILELIKGKKEKEFYDNGGYYRIFVRLQQAYGDELKEVLNAGDRDMELMKKRNIPTRMKIELLSRYLKSIKEIE